MKKIEKHHVICLVLLGQDWVENIIEVTEYQHKLIHATLNIPYSKIRSFRKKTNHLTHRNSQEFVNPLRELHLSFFNRINLLPLKLRNRIRDSVRETTKRIIKEERLIVVVPLESANIFKWLKCYHNCLILR